MNDWAFILGGSSGIGLQTAKKMAENGLNVFIVHRDSRSQMASVQPHFEKIKMLCHQFYSINCNAVSEEGMASIFTAIQQEISDGNIKLFLHAIAFGNLKPIIPENNYELSSNFLTEEDFQHTINAMGYNFATWSRKLTVQGYLKSKSRIIGLTSEGSIKTMENYAAVGAAKSTLEALSKYLAIELAPKGISVNLIRAGVIDTPALRAIPGHEKIMENARKRNPNNRLTTPHDIANVIYLLLKPEADWINGTIINVDGGEGIR